MIKVYKGKTLIAKYEDKSMKSNDDMIDIYLKHGRADWNSKDWIKIYPY